MSAALSEEQIIAGDPGANGAAVSLAPDLPGESSWTPIDLTAAIVWHDLRHTFGTLGAAIWPLHDLQGYMGHADIQTTMIYVHHVPKVEAADEMSRAVEAAMGSIADGASNGASKSANLD
jgi:integrase-like protein